MSGYQEYSKVATYNSMEAIIWRINDLWARFNSYVLRGKLIEANWVLDRLWGEFVADADDTTKHPDKQTFRNFRFEFAKLNKIKEKNKVYDFLMRKEEFLRILQDKQGKGVKHQESVDDYMDD